MVPSTLSVLSHYVTKTIETSTALDTEVYNAARLSLDTALAKNIRFTDEDIDQYLRAYAEDFLCDYIGDFRFIFDLQQKWNHASASARPRHAAS